LGSKDGKKPSKKPDTVQKIKPKPEPSIPQILSNINKKSERTPSVGQTVLISAFSKPVESPPPAPKPAILDDSKLKFLDDPFRASLTDAEKASLKHLYASINTLNMENLSDETRYKLYLYQQRKEEIDRMLLGIKSKMHSSIMSKPDCDEQLRSIFDAKMKSVYSENYANKFANNFLEGQENSPSSCSDQPEEDDFPFLPDSPQNRFNTMAPFYERVPDDTEE
jgi:hypothetical protein